MKIREIETFFKEEETLEQVLDYCQVDFDSIDKIMNAMKQGVNNNPENAKEALTELTGIYMYLLPIVSIAETEKKNRESAYYEKVKIEIENSGKKFTSAPVEREASGAVSNYRRIRNIVQAYLQACEKAISTLQSLLKYMSKEDIH